MRTTKAVIGMTFFLLLASSGLAQEEAGMMRTEADKNVQLATELMGQAKQLLTQNPNRANMRAAMSLYVRAGQLFEQSASLYRNIIPDFASQEDVYYSEQAVQSCIRAVQEIKSRI